MRSTNGLRKTGGYRPQPFCDTCCNHVRVAETIMFDKYTLREGKYKNSGVIVLSQN